MTATKPTILPRWADNPPVAPPSTITEPSEPEKDEGFQPGGQAQIDDFVIAHVVNSHAYNITINGVAFPYTSDGSATLAEILAGLIASVNGGTQPVVASNATPGVRVTATVAGQAFVSTTSDATNVTIVNVQSNKSGKPIRQYINWFFNLVYQWVAWFFYATFVWGDIGDEYDAVGQGAATAVTPLTRIGTSGTAVSWIGDRRAVGLLELHTYDASSDTYVDLARTGAWVYQPVSNGAGAPSIGVNTRRQYKVVTDGTGITSVVDLRTDLVPTSHPWRFNRNVAFRGATGNTAARTVKVDPSLAYTLMDEYLPLTPADQPGTRLYSNDTGGITIATGCYWDTGTFRWKFDAGALTSNPSVASIITTDGVGGCTTREKSVSGANTSTNWTVTAWTDAKANNAGRLQLGDGISSTLAFALLARVTAHRVSNGTSGRTCLLEDSANGSPIMVYLSHEGASGLGSVGACLEVVTNAIWNADGTWHQVQNGYSAKTEIALAGGLRTLQFFAGSATTFPDTINNGGDWTAPSFTYSVPGIAGAFGGTSGGIDPSLISNAVGAGNTEVGSNGSAALSGLWPIHLPHNAIMQSVGFNGSVTLGGGTFTGRVRRFVKATGLADECLSSPAVFTDQAYGLADFGALNGVNAVIDNTLYTYYVSVIGTAAVEWFVRDIQVTYVRPLV